MDSTNANTAGPCKYACGDVVMTQSTRMYFRDLDHKCKSNSKLLLNKYIAQIKSCVAENVIIVAVAVMTTMCRRSEVLFLCVFFIIQSTNALVSSKKVVPPSAQVRWWMNVGALGDNMSFINSERDALTGIYVYGGRIDSGGTFVATYSKPEKLQPYLALGLTVHVAISLDVNAVLTSAATNGIEDIVIWSRLMNISGVMFDYEPNNHYSRHHASLYASFLGSITAAMHLHGKDVEMCIAGWGILRYYDVFAGTVDTAMSMSSTYFGTDITFNERNIELEMAAGISVNSISVGIGTMLKPSCAQRQKWNYKWSKSSLHSFISWIKRQNIHKIAFWRADIDAPGSGSYCTEPWYFDLAKMFLRHPNHLQQQDMSVQVS